MMFPPPMPWNQCAPIDPQREYVAFTSRFFMKSLRRVPAFMASGRRIMEQANLAPGIIGWSLGGNLFRLEFATLSVWEDAESLRRFVRDGSHKVALEAFENDVRRKSIFSSTRYWDETFRRPGRTPSHGRNGRIEGAGWLHNWDVDAGHEAMKGGINNSYDQSLARGTNRIPYKHKESNQCQPNRTRPLSVVSSRAP